MEKTFILGVGAQKSGTSWLYAQLIKNNNVDMGFKKEYHVFDTIYTSRANFSTRNKLLKKFMKNKNTILPKPLGSNLARKKDNNSTLLQQLSFISNPEHYFDYFGYLAMKNQNVDLVGDITPSYAGLDPEVYKMIKNELEKRDLKVKVIFLMRDPIERLWSMARMARRNKAKLGKKNQINETEEEQLMRLSTGKAAIGRTRYDKTIANLEKIFPREDIMYGFYESMFEESFYNEFRTFLGVDLIDPDFEQIRNASPKTTLISDDLFSKLVQSYSMVYTFIHEKFGDIPLGIWPGYKYLDMKNIAVDFRK